MGFQPKPLVAFVAVASFVAFVVFEVVVGMLVLVGWEKLVVVAVVGLVEAVVVITCGTSPLVSIGRQGDLQLPYQVVAHQLPVYHQLVVSAFLVV